MTTIDDFPDGSLAIAGRWDDPNSATINPNFFVIKTNPNGSILWQKEFGGESSEFVTDVKALSDGGAIVVGSTYSQTGFGSGNQGGANSNDGFVLRLDANGNTLWVRLYGGSGFEFFSSILPLPNGGFVMAGRSSSNDGDVGNAFGDGDGWLLKIDQNGDIIWSKVFGDQKHQYFEYIGFGQGNTLVAAGTRNEGTNNSPDWSTWSAEFTLDGDLNWQTIQTSTYSDFGKSIIPADNGGYWMFYNNIRAHTAYMDGNGNILFNKTISQTRASEALSAEKLSNNRIAIGGRKYGTLGLPDSDEQTLDAWLYIMDGDGNKLWEKTYGEFKNESIWAMTPTPDGGFALCGSQETSFGSNMGFPWLVKFGTDICTEPGDCSIASFVSNIQCDNNGTPQETTDDTYSFDVTITNSSTCGSGWTGGGTSGNYGVPVSFGPYPIAGGDISLTFNDTDDPSVTTSATATAPAPCSGGGSSGCQANLLGNPGFENGLTGWSTSGDVSLTTDALSGNNAAAICNGVGSIGYVQAAQVGTSYNASFFGKITGSPKSVVARLRFLDSSWTPISQSPTSMNHIPITSTGYQQIQMSNTAPASATYVQLIIWKENGGCAILDDFELCEDGGGSSTITIDCSTVENNFATAAPFENQAIVNFTEPTFNSTCPQGGGTLTITQGYAPGSYFPIGETEVCYEATDNCGNTANCCFTVTVEQGNLTCAISISTSNILCNDNGTPNDDTDDTFTFDMTIDSPNAGLSSWSANVSGINASGQYGETVNFGPFPIPFIVSYNVVDVNIVACLEGGNFPAPPPCSNGEPGGDIDLELRLVQSNNSPAQWSHYSNTATLTNKGGQDATGVNVHFPKPTGVVYTGGNEYTTSQGSFSVFGNEEWSVGTIPAGGSATLTVSYFLLENTAPVAYAQVTAANETDADSTPNNGTPPSVIEDDEANTAGGSPALPDLTASNLDILNSPIEAGQVLSYEFDISNQGSGAASGDFSIKAWISTDNTLSSDDIQDGLINTGNYGPGLTVTDIAGASSIPTNLADGNYYLLLKVDADDEVTESNESNNLISAPFEVGGGSPCEITAHISNIQCNLPFVDYELTVTGNGNGSVGIFIPTDQYGNNYFYSFSYGQTQNIHAYFGQAGTNTYGVFDTQIGPPDCIDQYDITCAENGDIDLSLSMTAVNVDPTIYTSTEITLSITNDGPQTATGVVVEFPKPDGTVYTGGSEWSATQGSFIPFGEEQWEVGDLSSGATASLTVNYFLLTENTLTPYAQVVAANETDGDSTPDNGICCTPNEDDEISFILNDGGGSNLASQDFKGRPIQLQAVYPNPVYFGEITVVIFSELEGTFDLEIYDLLGRKAISKKIELEEGRNAVPMEVYELESGTYYLNMPGQNWRNMPLRFVVARW